MTPKTLKSALESGYILNRVNNYYPKVRVDLKPRFYNQGMKAVISFWVTYNYAKRIWPNVVF